MDTTELNTILQNPSALTKEQTEELKMVLEEHPYFQSVRAVYLKGLKHLESFKYNQALKTTAAYTTDRSILFDFITSEAFLQNKISESIKKNSNHLKTIEVDVEDISVNKKTTVDDVLKKQIDDTTGVLDPELFQPKEISASKVAHFSEEEVSEQTVSKDSPSEGNASTHRQAQDSASSATGFEKDQLEENTSNEQAEKDASPKEILGLGKPFSFKKGETHSFNEWLKLSRFSPIKRDEEEIEEEPSEPSTSIPEDDERARKFALIDKFIAENPKIDPKKSVDSSKNIAKEKLIKPEELMTETLARIYVEQKKYDKAIQSYKVLSLKYPEKSGFFADQIKAIEKLQDQNK